MGLPDIYEIPLVPLAESVKTQAVVKETFVSLEQLIVTSAVRSDVYGGGSVLSGGREEI